MNVLSRIKILIIILSALFVCVCLQAADRPNIIYIVADDLGWTDLHYAGSQYYQTPNIDHLSSEGMVFTNAYAGASNCAPSRACAISGQYTPRHGIYTVNDSERGNAKFRKIIPVKTCVNLPDENITIAEALKTAGYVTCFAGKWHLGKDPRTQGFDCNIAGGIHGHPRSYFSPYGNRHLKDGPEGEYLTDRLTDEVIDFVRNQENSNNPFFLYLAYYSVHTPLQAKQEDVQKYKSRARNQYHNNPKYGAMVSCLDENIGRLMKILDKCKLADNTFILFTSDNGGAYSISKQWPLRAGKGSYYEGGIREPMIVRWPGRVKAGSVCKDPVSNIDFYPTFLEAAGIKKPDKKVLDGISLLPLITAGQSIPERPLFWHFPIYLQGGNDQTQDPIFRTRPGSAVRLGDWKLIEYFENGNLELYNLKQDIGEKNNLVGKEPDKTRRFHKLLKEWRKSIKAPVPSELNPEYNPSEEKQAIKKLNGQANSD